MLKRKHAPYDNIRKFLSQYLGIQKIEEDSILLDDGILVSILKVEPIDFTKLTEKKKKEVLTHYQSWIDSLDHSVQILSRSINLDFFERLKIMLSRIEHDIKKTPNKKDLFVLFREFSDWINDTLQDHPNRLFFVVIPYAPEKRTNSEKFVSFVKHEKEGRVHLDKLQERVSSTIEKLSKTGVTVSRMNTDNINELLLSYFILSIQTGTRNNLTFDMSTNWFEQFKESRAEVE